MKKTLTLLVALLISVGAMAQLNVTSAHENTIENLGQNLKYDSADSIYYIVLTTSNRFDDPMLFNLGKGKESAMATLKDLKGFIETSAKGDVINVDSGFGKQYRLDKYDKFNIMVTGKGYAGHSFIYKNKLERWSWLIETHGE